MIVNYIAYLHKDKDSDYGVSFPDCPGCITAGRTIREARSMAAEALAVHIQGMIEDGEVAPEASKLDDLEEDPEVSNAFLVGLTMHAGNVLRVFDRAPDGVPSNRSCAQSRYQ
jgi:predicted RNase H-like HicB family nuclease